MSVSGLFNENSRGLLGVQPFVGFVRFIGLDLYGFSFDVFFFGRLECDIPSSCDIPGLQGLVRD